MKSRISCFAILLGATFNIQAATSLLEVYNSAVENDPQLKQAVLQLKETQQLKPQARALLFPTVSASAGYYSQNVDLNTQASQATIINGLPVSAGDSLDTSNDSTYGMFTASVNQPLFDWGAWSAYKIAGSQISSAELTLVSEQQDLIIRVAKAYFDVLAANDNVEFQESEKTATARQLEQSQKRHEFGQIASTDVYEAKARYDQTLAALINATNDLRSKKEALREITGKYYASMKPLSETLELNEPDPADVEHWVKHAFSDNPDIQALTKTVKAAEQNVSYKRSSYYPTVNLTGSYSKTDTEYDAYDQDTDTSQIGIAVTIPIYQGGLRGAQVDEAVYQYQNAQEQLEEVRRTLDKQVRDAYWGISSNISRIEALEQALKSTQIALEATETGYDVGTRTIVDVLTAQTLRHSAEKNLKQARYDYLINHLQLKAASGALTLDDLKTVNKWLR